MNDICIYPKHCEKLNSILCFTTDDNCTLYTWLTLSFIASLLSNSSLEAKFLIVTIIIIMYEAENSL